MEQILHNYKAYLRYPLIFAIAAVIATSGLFGEITPFTLVFIGSLAGADVIFAFLGSVCAFLVNGQLFEAIPNLSVMLIMGVFRFFLGNIAGNRLLNITSAIMTGSCVALVGFFTAVRPTEIISTVAIAIAAGFLSHALTVTYRFMSSGYMGALLRISSICAASAVMIFAAAVLSNLSFVNEYAINLGVLFGAVVSLTLANKYRYLGGSIGGILTAAGITLANADLSAGMVVFAAAAAASALLTRFGRVTQSAGFIFVMGVGISAIGLNSFTLTVMLGASAGSILYIILPAVGDSYPGVPHSTIAGGKSGLPAEIFAERLRLAGTAINDVKSAVEKAGEILDKRNTKDFSWVYNTAGDLVCKKCKHNVLCWGDEYNDTVNVLNKTASTLRKGEQLSESCLPPKLAARCERKQQLIYAISDRYREYVTVNSANRKITEMRTVLTAQLSATESLMFDMSEEFLDYSHYDREMAQIVEQILAEQGVERPRAIVTINEGRASIEAYGKVSGQLTVDSGQLGDLIAAALHRQFDLPEIIYTNKNTNKNNCQLSAVNCQLTMFERAVYGIEYGAYQLSKFNQRSCGDYYDSFVDSKGYAYIILSDGMGSGSRARIDSAFACGMLVKLLRAGIGLPSALEIINNSLLVKSSDESFATLDICKIDLYSGKAELFKAGAAASYIRCNKRMVKAAGRGLPVGIGYKAVYESQSFVMGNSDMLIMASDGAELNEKWLEHELTNKTFTDLNETAKVLAESARFAAGDDETHDKNREDDISVIAVKLIK